MTTLSINTLSNVIHELEDNVLSSTRNRGAKMGQLPGCKDQFGAALHTALEEIGEHFGLYDIMSQSGPITPACLATQAGMSQQSVLTWLEARASGEYLHHGPRSDLYCLWCPWSPGRGGSPR